MKISLKQGITSHIEAIELNQSQLDVLHGMQEDKTFRKIQNNKNKFYQYFSIALAASIILCFGFYLLAQTSPNQPISHLIANEVAYNHLKLKPLEVKSNHLNIVYDYFSELDFKPGNSIILKQTNWQLLGGRYCSIQGNRATQIRFKDAEGRFHTHYQTAYNSDQFNNIPLLEKGKAPIEIYAKGILIKIWVEKNLVNVLTF